MTEPKLIDEEISQAKRCGFQFAVLVVEVSQLIKGEWARS